MHTHIVKLIPKETVLELDVIELRWGRQENVHESIVWSARNALEMKVQEGKLWNSYPSAQKGVPDLGVKPSQSQKKKGYY
jgi:hypothetical protein